ncbi:MAG: hypothetical protein KKB65_05290 [Nanoarchaeota archaeon]|nr:hypothetical protein [Nanoarchaeota archaeon]MBU1030619.1 hypothetical protein [Nanoarchaeota archaeon]MBU1850572.1 hypothetical protein [Nanoarchaeota archaeon]
MALTKEEIKKFREIVANTYRPLIFFDDDPDGMSSFLQIYKEIGDGRGFVLKTAPELSASFSSRTEHYEHDRVFILDIPSISQEFLDNVKSDVVWLDHHPVVLRKKVTYFNPRVHNDKDNRPTSYWLYRIFKKNLWIAMVGCIGDWFIPEFSDAFSEKFPDLLPKGITYPGEALFDTKIGLLAKIVSFNLKGKHSDVMKSMKILTRIESPYEILKQTTPRGKFVYKRFEQINKEYEELLSSVEISDDSILFFEYNDSTTSFTGDMSNELLYRYPEKIIIVARSRNGEMKCSLRASKYKLSNLVKKALLDVDGYGGGHTYACGACIKIPDFQKFLQNLRDQIR